MKRPFFLPLLYMLFWLLFFAVARAVFLFYHGSKTAALSASEIAGSFLYGLRLDASFASYICALPFLLYLLQLLFRKKIFAKLINGFTYIIIVLLSLLVVTDLELYRAWGFRLDATPLQYLETPAEMAASAGAAPVWLLVLLFLLLAGGFIFIYYLFLMPQFKKLPATTILPAATTFLYTLLLVIPMRGGFQQIPINQSDVYFSNNLYANHAGINVPWNFMHSLMKRQYNTENPYKYLPKEEARELVAQLYKQPDSAHLQVVNQARPNVLFVILESYTAKMVGCMGGAEGVTPALDALAKNGILFDNIYSSGDRSEKGLVALLSGYPVQTTTSIIKTPKKTEQLPHLADVFKQNGYSTSFYYGGELAFANIKSFLLNAGYERLIAKNDFPESSYNSKWGVHDHVLLERLMLDLNREQKPFFSTVFTLSSHEPYDIPIEARFPGTDEATLFQNSCYYTDQAVGNFMEEAQKQPWWDNTLVVLVADHGHALPANDPNYAPSKFKIPLIFTGGALSVRDTTIHTLGSQTDIATTLLAQLNLPHESFKWGKNLLNPEAQPFAFYVFNDGFGWISEEGVLTFDNVSKKPITRDSTLTEMEVKLAKAYMQVSFEDFLNK